MTRVRIRGPWLARSAGMTINTIKDPGPDAKLNTAIELPSTSKAQPASEVSPATSEPDLEARIKLRRAELVAKLRELRADVRLEATQAGDRLKAKLSEVAHILKEGVVDGWTNLGDSAKHKLEHWLADSARQLASHDGPAKPGQS